MNNHLIFFIQGPPPGGPPGPGTPILPSPQDSSNSGGENMYTIMKPVVSSGVSIFLKYSLWPVRFELI